MMFFGGVAVVCLARAAGAGRDNALSVLTGCVLTCVAACVNGRLSGNVHPSHHIIRGAAAVLLTAGFFIW